jgi:hypothetical protein
MPALFGKAAHDPDVDPKALKNEAKELDMQSQARMAKALVCSPLAVGPTWAGLDV